MEKFSEELVNGTNASLKQAITKNFKEEIKKNLENVMKDEQFRVDLESRFSKNEAGMVFLFLFHFLFCS